MKGKFDSAQIKAFLLNHVEKLVFGGFVVAFLLICWSAFKFKPYEKTPAELKKLSDDVSQQVEAKTPPDKFADLPSVPDFSNLGAVGVATVDPRFYAVKPFNLPYEERQERRKEPKFLVLEDLVVYANYGGIAIGEEGQVERTNQFGSGTGDMSPMGPMGPMGSDYMPPGMGPMGPGGGGMGPMGPGGGGMGPMGPGGGGMGPMGPGGGGMGPMGPMGAGGGRRVRRPSAAERRRAERVAAKNQPAPRPLPRPKPQTERIVITQPPQGSEVEGRYWVCLVGAIPYWKQLNEYQITFRDARAFEVKRDYPKYMLPIIERAEVNGADVGEWEKVDVERATDDLAKWAAEYPEVVDKQFLDPDLTEPLPPLVYANHEKEKVSHPRMKVEEPKTTVAVTKKKKAKNLTATNTHGQQGGGMGNSMNPMGPGNAGGGYGNMYNNMGGGAGPSGPLVEYRLFRFFDFDVDPGKTYRYRVKLVLRNPNAGVPPRFLENYDYAKGETRAADWSKPSPDVAVIAGNRLLAGTVTPGREPTGHVLAKLFDAKLATEIRRLFDINRGSVLNEHDAKVGIPEGAAANPREATLDFETNAVVLDMFGGDKIPGARAKSIRDEQPKVPGHFLVLDNDGELRTLVQSADAGMYETEKEEADRQKPGAAGDNARAGPNSTPDNGFLDFNNVDTGPKPRNRR